jgi:DNA repair protein RecN (Recombination protein N)
MLTDLTIHDVVIIDRLNVAFTGGFVALTGETGAGKSIILDALGLALGSRGEARLVRAGAQQASVTASFNIADAKIEKNLRALCDENGIAFDMPLLLRRVLGADGRSKAFVNDHPVGVGFLKILGDQLVEIHGQFETQHLLDPKTHRALLDDVAGVDTNAVRAAWDSWRNAVRKKAEIEEMLAVAARDRDYWDHAVSELRDMNPKPGEEQELTAQRSVMMHAEKLLAALAEAESALTSDNGARNRLGGALRALERVADKMPDGIAPLLDTLNNALIQADEAVDALEMLADKLQFDRNAQGNVDERLFALRGLARKYQVTVDGLAEFLAQTEDKLKIVSDQSAALDAATQAVATTRMQYMKAAEGARTTRHKHADALARDVMAELGPLKLDKARFAVSVTDRPEEGWGADGMDNVTFLISTNPGTPPGPLNKIASGGEMARFMLALKLVTQRAGSVPTMIFDEVDTGVGGAVADAIGLRLRRLGGTAQGSQGPLGAQVLAVTHSPQVAAKGHQHLKITKATDKNTTRTVVDALDNAARREEIARMLSGEKITAEARAAADHLLDVPPAETKPKTKRKTAA